MSPETPINSSLLSGEGRTDRWDKFSPLEIRDKVVIMSLFDQLVTEAQVAALWLVWRHKHLRFSREPFWRLMTLLPGTDPESFFAQAARVAGIEDAYISPRTAIIFIRDFATSLPPAAWRRMISIPVLPVANQGSQEGGLLIATHDPTNPLVKELLSRLPITNYELRYAPKETLTGLLKEAFPV